MIAIGIDLGGTKAEAQLFDADWTRVETKRVATPDGYPELLDTLANLIAWAGAQSENSLPIGISAAGLIHPETGRVTATNLPSDGGFLARDISDHAGHPVTIINDSAALALSEAQFGAAKGARRALALVIGTGVSGAAVQDGVVQTGATGTLGEFGHIAAPAHLIAEYDLPLVKPAGGQPGCIETLISGPGLTHIAQARTGQGYTPEDIVDGRASVAAKAEIWQIWIALVADLLRTLTRTIDPDVIVLGGGLSKVSGVADDLSAALQRIQFGGFPIPMIRIAEGGDASGARGAAYAAWRAAQ